MVVTAGESGRGNRSSALIREEYRQIKKEIDDSILSPFQTIRQTQYLLDPYYENISELKEEPINIYISSSWLDNGHWMWDIVDMAESNMLKSYQTGDIDTCLLAFDESITLKHNIRTMKQMQNEKKNKIV